MPLIIASVLCQLVAVLFLKQNALTHPGAGFAELLHLPLFWAAIAALFAQAVLWQRVLTRYPLSYAYPVNSLMYPFALVAGWALFGEAITAARIVGSAAIVAGIWLFTAEASP